MALQRVGWENGTLVEPAKVLSDNTVQPAQYEGTTPLSAANLKKMEDNFETFVNNLFPIGYIIYVESSQYNPNNYYPGTWERIKGKMIVGVDEDDTDFASSGLTGGEKEHTLTIDEMPSHSHTLYAQATGGSNSVVPRVASSGTWDGGKISSTGGGQPHNNMPPYETAYIWKRVS